MRIGLLIVFIIIYISSGARAQNIQSVISLESRLGYSTNTYLNPFFSEWDTSVESSYGVVSLLGQTFWHKSKNSIDLTGGLVVEPLFEGQGAWKGALGVGRYQRSLSSRLSASLETGGSYFASTFDRGMVWILPSLTWSPSSFTLLRVKAGSNFRSYSNYPDSVASNMIQRLDLYTLEFETWPSFHWHLKAGVYGQLKTLPSFHEGFSSNFSAGYVFQNGAQIRLRLGLQQFDQYITTTSGGGGTGFPPGGPPRETTQTQEITDRIVQAGVTVDYPVNQKWSLFARADMMDFRSSSNAESRSDVHMSGGVRFSFQPRIRGGSGKSISPDWDKKEGEQTVKIFYKGEGRLYLTGDFNNWKQPGIPLTEQTSNTFVTRLHLEPGAYEYKVLLINGSSEGWIEISENSYTVDDGFGGRNALLLVE